MCDNWEGVVVYHGRSPDLEEGEVSRGHGTLDTSRVKKRTWKASRIRKD